MPASSPARTSKRVSPTTQQSSGLRSSRLRTSRNGAPDGFHNPLSLVMTQSKASPNLLRRNSVFFRQLLVTSADLLPDPPPIEAVLDYRAVEVEDDAQLFHKAVRFPDNNSV